jgi:hypothetical protein
LVGLTVCTLFALLFAILAVLPSLRYPRDSAGEVDVLSPGFNLLLFGHFSHLSRDRFESLLDSMMRDEAEIYRMIARDSTGRELHSRKRSTGCCVTATSSSCSVW